MPDLQCSWWPDRWFGISLTDCCVAHDLGGSDWELAQCVAGLHPGFAILGVAMFAGVKLFGPVYRAWKSRKP